MLKSKVIVESLAVSSLISAFTISILIGVNHGGTLLLGLIYVPADQPVLSPLFYSFLVLASYYNYVEGRRLNRGVGIFRVVSVWGFCLFSIGVSSHMHSYILTSETLIGLNVTLFNILLIIVGVAGEEICRGKASNLLEPFSDRDFRDMFLLSSSLFLLSTLRLLSNKFPSEAAALFLLSSWAIMLFSIKDKIWLNSVKNLIFIVTVNLFYLYMLTLIF